VRHSLRTPASVAAAAPSLRPRLWLHRQQEVAVGEELMLPELEAAGNEPCCNVSMEDTARLPGVCGVWRAPCGGGGGGEPGRKGGAGMLGVACG
jgi:hypothetical protein